MQRTEYSEKWPGDEVNYDWPVCYDWTWDRSKLAGTLGISQTLEDGTVERVLLSTRQIDELLRFIKSERRTKRLTVN